MAYGILLVCLSASSLTAALFLALLYLNSMRSSSPPAGYLRSLCVFPSPLESGFREDGSFSHRRIVFMQPVIFTGFFLCRLSAMYLVGKVFSTLKFGVNTSMFSFITFKVLFLFISSFIWYLFGVDYFFWPVSIAIFPYHLALI